MRHRGKDPGSLLDLLEGKDTGDATCKLPQAKLPDGQTAPDEVERQENCDDHGKPGKNGSGTFGNGLGNFASSGCTLVTPDQLQQMMERTAAMEQCMKEMAEDRGNPYAEPITAAAIAVTIIVGVTLLALEYYVIQKDIARTHEREEYDKAVRNASDALYNSIMAADALAKAQERVDKATKALEKAKKDVDEKMKAKLEADAHGTPEEQQAAQAALEEAEGKQAETQVNKDTADAEADIEGKKKASEEADKRTREKAHEVQDKRPNEDSLGENDPFKSASCEKAFGFGLNERLQRWRLGDDWQDYKSRLKKVGNWSPDQQSPYDALDLDACGLDVGTNQTGAAKCSSLILCAEGTTPDEDCKTCNSGASASIAELVQSIQAHACETVQCENATAKSTPHGMVCNCSAGEEGVGTGGGHPKPKPIVVDTMMGSLQSMTSEPHVTSSHIMRSLFDGQAHEPVAR